MTPPVLEVGEGSIRFSLFGRAWCHLCEDMLVALREALDGLSLHQTLPIDEYDVDADPALLERYDELVPVLVGHRAGHPPIEICHYVLDPDALAAFLSSAGFHVAEGGACART